MKRRKFFQITGTGAVGLSMLGSCSRDKKTSQIPTTNNAIRETPPYRKNIKKTFSKIAQKSASDKVILALIGAGSFGTNLALKTAGLQGNTRFKYVCDVDETRGGRVISELKKIQGFEPIRVKDMRKVFDDPEVDAVLIATPEHWHALATIWACMAGKDVYVEKCISHNIFEGQQMIGAAMENERIVQCGTQNRSAEYAYSAREYLKSGKLGELVSVHIKGMLPGPVPFNEKENGSAPDTLDWDMWLGPAPKVPYNLSRHKSWVYYWDYSGGHAWAGGMSHQLDMARLILNDPGFPKSVYCAGGRYFFDDGREVPDYQMAVYDFEDFVLTAEAGQCTSYMKKTPPEIRFGEGFPEWRQNATRIEILGTEAMMYVGRMGGGWQVFDKSGKVVAEQSGVFPLEAHIQNYLDCIRSRNQPNGNIVQGHNSATLIHLANLSYRSGNKQLMFSPEYEKVLNNERVEEMTKPHFRKGFEIQNN